MFDRSMSRETSNAKNIHNAESNELVAIKEITSRHADRTFLRIYNIWQGVFGSCFHFLYFSFPFFNAFFVLNFANT